MVDEITITIEPPREVVESAEQEADHGGTDTEDQILDRLQINWESDPRA